MERIAKRQQATGHRSFFTAHWPLVTAILVLAGGWLLTAGCGGGGGGAVTDQQKAEIKGLVTGNTQGADTFSGLEGFSAGVSNLYVYIPTSPVRSHGAAPERSTGTFTDGEGNEWSYTVDDLNGSGSATTTYPGGVQATVTWTAVIIDEVTGDELWSYSYDATDGSSSSLNFRFRIDGSISITGDGAWVDTVTGVTYTMSVFTMDFPATGGFSMHIEVQGDDGTSLSADFSMSADGNLVTTSITYTDATGYGITSIETFTFDPVTGDFTFEYTFHDSEGYSGDLTLYSDGSGHGHIRDPNGDEIATIDIGIGGSPITVFYRDGTSEVIEGSMSRSLARARSLGRAKR